MTFMEIPQSNSLHLEVALNKVFRRPLTHPANAYLQPPGVVDKFYIRNSDKNSVHCSAHQDPEKFNNPLSYWDEQYRSGSFNFEGYNLWFMLFVQAKLPGMHRCTESNSGGQSQERKDSMQTFLSGGLLDLFNCKDHPRTGLRMYPVWSAHRSSFTILSTTTDDLSLGTHDNEKTCCNWLFKKTNPRFLQ